MYLFNVYDNFRNVNNCFSSNFEGQTSPEFLALNMTCFIFIHLRQSCNINHVLQPATAAIMLLSTLPVIIFQVISRVLHKPFLIPLYGNIIN